MRSVRACAAYDREKWRVAGKLSNQRQVGGGGGKQVGHREQQVELEPGGGHETR
jgi:hypothetical protein